MTFWDHIDALRGVIFKICIVVVVLSIGFFCVMPAIFDKVILAPCRHDFPLYTLFDGIKGNGTLIPDFSSGDFNVSLINIRLASQFMLHMSMSIWGACIAAFPVIIYLLWTFVSPALYDNERRQARQAFGLGCSLFYSGVLAGYFIVFPLALRFLAEYKLSESITNTISIDSYMDTFFMIVLAMGIVFELPLLAWILGKMRLITRSFFKRFRRHAIVVLLITSALITPTGDPVTLFAVFIPLYTLWEFGGRLVPKKAVDD
ncbi:MAG: twin-arginine translocase subunit TatC [Muribaculaceae bacterium]|nr:twin-arginine translocase subunit TatC [Muribaculaceae bacterium]